MDTRLVAREKQLESWALIIQECKNSGLKTKSKCRCLEEVKRHLNAKKNSKVILTDGITWTFYERELNPIGDIF